MLWYADSALPSNDTDLLAGGVAAVVWGTTAKGKVRDLTFLGGLQDTHRHRERHASSFVKLACPSKLTIDVSCKLMLL